MATIELEPPFFFNFQQLLRRFYAFLITGTPVVFYMDGHWSADIRMMEHARIFYFLGERPAGLNLVDVLEDPACAEQVAFLRNLSMHDDKVRAIVLFYED
eukprot:SAG22_NODE_8470_length_653_cov_1.944043_1_plen_99_part_01